MANIKVLLNEKVEKLGEVGEIVSVKPGYARNYLLPEGLATLPTPGEVKRMQKKKELLEKQYQAEKLEAEEIANKVNKKTQFTITAKAGEAGKLFGRVTAKEIAEKISEETGVEIDRKKVILKRALSDLGEYEIKLKLHNEVTCDVKVVIKNEE